MLVYCKRVSFRNSHREELHRARCGERAKAFMFLRHILSPNLHAVTQWESLWTPSFLGLNEGFITGVWLIKSLVISDQFNLQPIPSLDVKECWKFQHSNHIAGSPGNQASSFGDFQSTFTITFMAVSLRTSQGFRSSVSEAGKKTQYIFLVINYNITHHKLA